MESYIIEPNRGRQLKYPQYFLATLNTKVDVMLLPTGYNSNQPPSEKFCDYDQCSILLDTENSQQALICNYVYHSNCLKILNFIYLPCIRYFCDRIKKLSQSFMDRLSKEVLENSEEEEEAIINENNENDDMFEMDKLDENYLAQEKFFYSLSLF
ncbi:4899_t:CDS:2 [Funneliformis caledonium]|uniref:4899_t:CDS:1 n=1 Tax=Funneliformis caledonium TaxID=1117310 RepID=A0A9N9D7R1_9GLOM|nr:4899_t:CDS:2 [Funneliformis caledonium]